MYDYKFFDWQRVSDEYSIYRSKEFSIEDINERKLLPKTPGCYIWSYKNKILYVGKGTNIRFRFGNHLFATINDPISNSIYSTSARDAVAKHFFPDYPHESFRSLDRHQKESNDQYRKIWSDINGIVRSSFFTIYSTKTPGIACYLEEELTLELSPVCNKIGKSNKAIRDDFEVLGI